jgi:hypothetical protein
MRNVYWAGLIAAVSLFVLYLFQGHYPEFMTTFSNYFPPFIAGAAVIASIFALRKYWRNLGERFSRIWLAFTLGICLWFLGEVGWAIYVLLGTEMPYPSLADIAWLAGYVPLFIAVYLYIRTFREAISKRKRIMAVALALVTGVVIFSLLASPIIATEEDLVTLAVDIAYPALDISLLMLALMGLLVFLKGRIGKAWLLITGAIVMEVIADMLWSYTTLQKTYYDGHPLELLFHWGYILFALAFYTHMKEL